MTHLTKFLTLPILAFALSAPAVEVSVSDARPDLDVEVRNVTLANGVVSGFVANESSAILRDVQLLITYTWLWKDERNPGDDNPGRSERYTIPQDIPPGSAVGFKHVPDPPLPVQRTDGSFTPSVRVVGFTQVGE